MIIINETLMLQYNQIKDYKKGFYKSLQVFKRFVLTNYISVENKDVNSSSHLNSLLMTMSTNQG